MKVKLLCQWCRKEVYKYPSQIHEHVFCSQNCMARWKSKKYNPEGYPKVSRPDTSELNRQINKNRMTPAVRKKIRIARLGTGEGKSYAKLYGQAEHRVIAEKKIGRKLRPGEVVHHVDGNKRNNLPENLMVFKNQAEHLQWHKEHDREVMPK